MFTQLRAMSRVRRRRCPLESEPGMRNMSGGRELWDGDMFVTTHCFICLE